MCQFIRPEAFPELRPEDPKTAESTDWLKDIQAGTGKTVSLDDINMTEDLDVDTIERIR